VRNGASGYLHKKRKGSYEKKVKALERGQGGGRGGWSGEYTKTKKRVGSHKQNRFWGGGETIGLEKSNVARKKEVSGCMWGKSPMGRWPREWPGGKNSIT